MAETTAAQGRVRPYPPSWIDRLNARLARFRLPLSSIYVIFAVLLVAVQLLFLWLDGGLQAVELLAVILFNSAATPFLLGLIALLDRQALTALQSMQPVLSTSAAEFERYTYRLAHMPAPRPLAVGLVVLLLVILMEWLGGAPLRYAALERLPVFNIVFQIIDKSSAFLFGVFIYHTIRQLRLVNEIHARQLQINLFNLEPVRGFSRLTASTAIGLVVAIYPWLLINPELLADPAILGLVGLMTALAVAVFAWPLYGLHRRLADEQNRALQEIDQRFEIALAQFNAHFDREDYPGMNALNGAIASLEVQHRRVKAIPTWPWDPEMARSVLTAIAVPLLLAVLRFLVDLVLN